VTPQRAREPEAEAVLEGAAALLEAAGEAADAEVVRRSTLELAPMPSGSSMLLLSCVLRMPAQELHAVRADPQRHHRIVQAVSDAAARPLVSVGSMRLAVSLG
jgi:hypothetical protein